jgi:hypothetical protein
MFIFHAKIVLSGTINTYVVYEQMVAFCCKYLGLPQSLKSLTKGEMQLFLEKKMQENLELGGH